MAQQGLTGSTRLKVVMPVGAALVIALAATGSSPATSVEPSPDPTPSDTLPVIPEEPATEDPEAAETPAEPGSDAEPESDDPAAAEDPATEVPDSEPAPDETTTEPGAADLPDGLVDDYRNLGEVAEDAEVAVRGSAEAQSTTLIDGVTYTVTEVGVDLWINGDDPRPTITVMQVGTGETVGVDGEREPSDSDFSPLLRPGQKYLLYLDEWFPSGEQSGHFIISGDLGVFGATSGSDWVYAGQPDPDQYQGPEELTVAEFAAALYD